MVTVDVIASLDAKFTLTENQFFVSCYFFKMNRTRLIEMLAAMSI